MICTYPLMKESRLRDILNKINGVNIGILGDLCLDMYWLADMNKSLMSRETPHFPLPVVKEWTFPGAGGNVAANIKTLEPNSLNIIGVIGDDWRGMELNKCFENMNISTDTVIQEQSFITSDYCKPLRKGYSELVYEDPRIDFSNNTPFTYELEEKIITALHKISGTIDVLCVSDQFSCGVVTDRVRYTLLQLAQQGLIDDSSDFISDYRLICKYNFRIIEII